LIVLGIDASEQALSLGLVRDGTVLGCQRHPTGREASSLLPVVADDLLSEAGLSLEEVDVLAPAEGPGSFTGLRLVMALTKATAYALGCRLTPVPTLAVLAAQVRAKPGELVAPLLHARGRAAYAGLYRLASEGEAGENPRPIELHPPERLEVPEICRLLADSVSPEGRASPEPRSSLLLVGSGAQRLRSELTEGLGGSIPTDRFRFPGPDLIGGDAVAMLGWLLARDGQTTRPKEAVPRYYRTSSAERAGKRSAQS